jgi:RNA polymerase sigma-70 factor (ECF subfamily)
VASIRVAEPCPAGASTAAVYRRPVPFSLLRRDDEARLVQRARDGDDQAFAELYRRHFAAVYRVAFLICHDAAAAEDIAQEAFLAAVRNLDRFERGRPVRPWLARIASNRAIDWVRARARRAESALQDLPAAETDRGMAPDDAPALIARLPAEQRQVVALRFVLDLTPGEIASLLDLPRGTVNSRLRRGLDALGASLEEPS